MADGTTLSIAAIDAIKLEENTQTHAFKFRVTRGGLLNGDTTVHWTLSGDIDAADVFLGALSGDVTFVASDDEQDIDILVQGDVTIEPNENFVITLSGATDTINTVTIDQAAANGQILNDDPPAEVAVSGNGQNIVDGDITPAAGDHTDFGTVNFGGLMTRTFTVTNTGQNDLLTSFLRVIGVPPGGPIGYTITEGLSAVIAPQTSDTFTIQLNANSAGTKTNQIAFNTNDPDEGVFNFNVTGTVSAPPEVAVQGNANNIADGDSTPSSADHTDFGSATVGQGAVQRIFTVTNNVGAGPLATSNLVVPAGFTVIEGLSALIAAGGQDTFTVQLDTASAGVKSGQITFTTNDTDENPFNFSITGTVNTPPDAEVTVLGSGQSIADGDATPSPADHTDFGSVPQGGTAIERIFTVSNDGAAALTTSNLAVPAGFTVTEGLSGSIAAGLSDTFTVRLDTAVVGTKSGDITFTTNDPDESAFNFSITGTVDPPVPAAEVTVRGNGNSIDDGDATPSSADHTDFGAVTQGQTAIQRTFTVTNDGSMTLTTAGLVVPAGFTVTEGLSASIAPGLSDTFTVELDTGIVGTKSGEISFTTNDGDENPFNFSITGTVNPTLAEITVRGNGLSIPDGDITPSSNDLTEFGFVPLGQPALQRIFTVINDGGTPLTLGAPDPLTGGFSHDIGDPLTGGLAAGASDTFAVQLASAVFGVHYSEIRFTNSDGDESPFDFLIAGTVTNASTIVGTAAGETLNGTAVNDSIIGMAGDDTLNGGDVSDTLHGGAGADNMNGGVGFDFVSYSLADSGVQAFLNAGLGAGLGGEATGDLYTSIEGLIGSHFADVLVGNDASVLFVPNTMHGGAGDDVIYGEGLDTVSGGPGNDVFFGGGGGMVTLNLGTASIETVWGSVVGDILDGSTATNPLSVIGQGGGDAMTGGLGDDFLYYDHLDTVNGGAGNDWAVATLSSQGVSLNISATGFENTWGSPFDDVLTAAGGNSTVVIVGDVGNDTITGGNGVDFLYGFGGDDTIFGGTGGDVLVGDVGADRYAYVNPGDGFDSVFGFDTGVDKLQFTAANFGKNPGDPLTNGVDFIAGGAPAPAGATPTWLYNTGTGILRFDADGVGAGAPVSIAQIFLAPTVAAGDILFVS